jgi:hypothetical protein
MMLLSTARIITRLYYKELISSGTTEGSEPTGKRNTRQKNSRFLAMYGPTCLYKAVLRVENGRVLSVEPVMAVSTDAYFPFGISSWQYYNQGNDGMTQNLSNCGHYSDPSHLFDCSLLA